MTSPPTRPPENNGPATFGPAVRLLASVAQPLIGTLGALYIFGLLVINNDLARYRVSNLDLARPEYVLAGVLWLLVVGPSGMTWIGLVHHARERWHRRERGLVVVFVVLGVIASVVLPAFLLALFSPSNGFPWLMAARHSVTLTSNIVLVSVVASAVFSMRPHGYVDWRMRLFYSAQIAIISMTSCVVLLSVYAAVSFPYLAKMIGGGNKTVVELVLSEEAPKEWDALEMPLTMDRPVLGPVVLLFEAQGVVVVTERLARIWPLPAGHSNAVAIDRGRIAAIIYKERALDDWVTQR